MSDRWETYMVRIDDGPGFIFYDHGISEEIDSIEATNLLIVQISFKNPQESGLPHQDEFDELLDFENDLLDRVKKAGGAYFGRVTSGGHRVFNSYIDAAPETVEEFLTQLNRKHNYTMDFALVEDPERKYYWRLFPDRRDLQIIEDMKIVDSLRSQGDDLTTERRIDHLVTFEEGEDLQKFREFVLQCGFLLEGVGEPHAPGGRFTIRLYHYGTPQPEDVTTITVFLAETAAKFGGEYEGWETEVKAPAE